MDLRYFIELLTPKQDTEDLDGSLAWFAAKYKAVLDAGFVVSVPDNPMGNLHFQATEVIPELDLPFRPDQFLFHLNTFHTKEHLDGILKSMADMGAKCILVITGDGSERLPKLSPESIGLQLNSVTSVELIKHIEKEYPGRFTMGVAYNPYEPLDHELEKMHKKIDAGAKFIITQPVMGKDDRLDPLKKFNVPVVIGVWMSKNIRLLSQCVGYEIPEDKPYDPIGNLKLLRETYPECGVYFALLNMTKQMPLVKPML